MSEAPTQGLRLAVLLTRVSALVPCSVTPQTRIQIHPSDWMQIVDEVQRLGNELEIERMRLAACGTAALGYFKGCAQEYDSASLQDVLRLFRKESELRVAASKVVQFQSEEEYADAIEALDAALHPETGVKP